MPGPEGQQSTNEPADSSHARVPRYVFPAARCLAALEVAGCLYTQLVHGLDIITSALLVIAAGIFFRMEWARRLNEVFLYLLMFGAVGVFSSGAAADSPHMRTGILVALFAGWVTVCLASLHVLSLYRAHCRTNFGRRASPAAP